MRRRASLPGALAALLLLALPPAQGLAGDDTSYVIGSDADPDRKDDADRGPRYADVTLIRSHRYAERFSVETVAVSPDGKEIAALSRVSRQGPRAWDFASGRPLQLPPMPGNAAVVAYSPDMRVVAAAIQDDVLAERPGGIELFDMETGKPGRPMPGGQDARDLAFSPDGRVLVAAVPAGVIGWELDRGTPIDVLRLPGGADSVSFSSSRELMVSGSGGRTLLRVVVEEGRVAESWDGPGAEAVCISPDGRLVAMGGVEAIRIVDLWDGGKPQTVEVEGEIASLDWSASGKVLAAGTSSGGVLVFGVEGVRAQPSDGGTTTLSGSRARVETDSGPNLDHGRESGGGLFGGGGTRRADRGRESRSYGDRSYDDRGGDRSYDDRGGDDRGGDRGDDRGRDDRGGDTLGSRDDRGGGEPGLFGGLGGGGEDKPEVVADVAVLLLDSFGNDPRTGTQMERSLRENIKRIEPCWKREARRGEPALGKLILPMSVSAEGEGRGFGEVADDTVGNPKLLQCLQDKLRSNLFPPGLGSLEIELTVTLREER